MHRYEVALRVDGAPDAFDRSRVIAQYDIENESCLPRVPISGVKRYHTQRRDIQAERVNDGFYRAHVYADFLKDEDYFDLGICRWRITSVVGILDAMGNQVEVIMGRKSLENSASITSYFSSTLIEDNLRLRGGVVGRADPASIKRPFAIVMSAREVF